VLVELSAGEGGSDRSEVLALELVISVVVLMSHDGGPHLRNILLDHPVVMGFHLDLRRSVVSALKSRMLPDRFGLRLDDNSLNLRVGDLVPLRVKDGLDFGESAVVLSHRLLALLALLDLLLLLLHLILLVDLLQLLHELFPLLSSSDSGVRVL